MSSVSVVIPCYNYGHFLPDAVASVLEQQGVDVRVLIIDDASQDDSAEVARRIAASDPRVEVSVHPVNRGNLRTYNEGILDWADGDYTVNLSADDRLTPGALSRAAALLDAHPEVSFVYGHPLHFEHDKPLPVPRTTPRGWSVWNGSWWIERQFRLAHSCITSPEVVVRTCVQKKVGGYDLRLPHSGDVEMWMRLALYGDVGYVRGVDQAFYRVHQHNMTKARTVLVDLEQRRAAYEAFLSWQGEHLPDAARLGDIVHRKLAGEALWIAARAYDRRRTGQTPVEELVGFAFDCWPEAGKLPVYRGLRLRRRIGARTMPYLQPLVLSAVARRLQNELWWRSWKLRGL
jgi:glycosyltransferase involved in cell wall biosynthesis